MVVDSHFKLNAWHKTVGIVPNNKMSEIILPRVQKRNSETLYDFPVSIFLAFNLFNTMTLSTEFLAPPVLQKSLEFDPGSGSV
jgi:hypothetical protein